MRAVWLSLVVLSGCAESGWQWQRFTTLRDFGSFAGIDASGAPWAGTINGPYRFDSRRYDWQRIETPGAQASFVAAASGHEFASTYGVYTRASPSAEWQLLEGSRALDLVFTAEDAALNIYAITAAGPAGTQRFHYVRRSGSDSWERLALDGRVSTVFSSPTGTVYATDGAQQLVELRGAEVVPLTQPRATLFDFEGRRHLAEVPFRVHRVTAAGELELWHQLSGAGTPALEQLLGFGKDGRFYAVAVNVLTIPSSADYTAGDLISIGQGESTWKLAASPVSNGDDQPAGLGSFSSYGGSFAPDGSLYWGGCESGCTGSGNAFSYGLFRLTLGGQP